MISEPASRPTRRTRRTVLRAALTGVVTAIGALAWSVAHADAVDTQAPTMPGNFAVSNVTTNSLRLSWTPSTDDKGVTSYEVTQYYTSAAVIATTGPETTTVDVTGLKTSDTYRFWVVALDAAGNRSLSTGQLKVTMAPGDTVPPSQPGRPIVH